MFEPSNGMSCGDPWGANATCSNISSPPQQPFADNNVQARVAKQQPSKPFVATKVAKAAKKATTKAPQRK